MKNIAILFSILILIGLGIYFAMNMKKKDDNFSEKISDQDFIDKSMTDKKIDGFGKYDWTTRWTFVGIVVIIAIIMFLMKFVK